jgi:hypothetical protein
MLLSSGETEGVKGRLKKPNMPGVATISGTISESYTEIVTRDGT